jgi:CheY-like chemotaxis protein
VSEIPPTILIIEDDQAIAELIQLVLRPDGYFFRRLADGKMGVAVAKREKPDLIIMDVMMPEMDGYTAASELAADENTRDVPIIVTTAKRNMRDAFSQCPNVVGFLEKPFEPSFLRAEVQRALASRRPH